MFPIADLTSGVFGDIDTESLVPSSIGVCAGLQSAIRKSLRIDVTYPGWDSVIERAAWSRVIFIPRMEVAGLRSCNLKWEASSALTDWSAGLEFKVRSRSSTCMGSRMQISP